MTEETPQPRRLGLGDTCRPPGSTSYAFDFALKSDAQRFADDCGSPFGVKTGHFGYTVHLVATPDGLPEAAKSLLRQREQFANPLMVCTLTESKTFPEDAAAFREAVSQMGSGSIVLPAADCDLKYIEAETIADALHRLAAPSEPPADDITAPPSMATMPGVQILAHLGDLCRTAILDAAVRPHHVGVAFLLLSIPGEVVTALRELKPSEATPKHALLAAAAARLLAYQPTPQDVHLAIYFWQRLVDAEVANLQQFPAIVQDNKTGQLGMQRGNLFMPMPKVQAEQIAAQRNDVAQTCAALQRDLGELIRRSVPGHIEAIRAVLAHTKAADEADKGAEHPEPKHETERKRASHTKECPTCHAATERDDKHDAYFCRACNLWLEAQCGDSLCMNCGGRPDKPVAPADDKVGQVIHGPWSGKPQQGEA